MIKLPMSDYVSEYYKKQGIEFTLRQQAHFCWAYSEPLKDRMGSLKEILEISDDEKLNAEIRERMDYEEKAYDCFMTNRGSECIYVFYPDDREEYDTEYFSSAKNAVSYGICHADKVFSVEKRRLFDKRMEGISEKAAVDDMEDTDTVLSKYYFTREGDIRSGESREYKPSFDERDTDRFEEMFLCIKSPFACGDIVMGPDFDEPRIVNTDHDCFEEIYERLKDTGGPDYTDNCIRTDWIRADGRPDYDHPVPFGLWKVDSWNDEVYWNILQIMSKIAKAGGDILNLQYFIDEYVGRHESNHDYRKESRISETPGQGALKDLLRNCRRSNVEIDEKAELAEFREEKYGDIS